MHTIARNCLRLHAIAYDCTRLHTVARCGWDITRVSIRSAARAVCGSECVEAQMSGRGPLSSSGPWPFY
nr:MAG TPA: hypothetical protein [Caudoviricetes sp.]